VDRSVVAGKVAFAGLQLGLPQVTAAVGAVATTGAVLWFLRRTRLGAALEATAADREAAALMGIDGQKMFALAWGIGAACAGVAGALLSATYPIFPEVGASFILIAFVLVALGGFGSVAGAFWAGILVGVVEVVGGFLWDPAYKMVLVLSLYLLVVWLRPQGLLGKA
jgi:branched-chain amino acid transport system permease protein